MLGYRFSLLHSFSETVTVPGVVLSPQLSQLPGEVPSPPPETGELTWDIREDLSLVSILWTVSGSVYSTSDTLL